MGLLLGDVGQIAAVATGLSEQCVPQAPTLLACLYWVGLTLDMWDFSASAVASHIATSDSPPHTLACTCFDTVVLAISPVRDN
jgi:hypothetical protein